MSFDFMKPAVKEIPNNHDIIGYDFYQTINCYLIPCKHFLHSVQKLHKFKFINFLLHTNSIVQKVRLDFIEPKYIMILN